jgi:hypothetical protein
MAKSKGKKNARGDLYAERELPLNEDPFLLDDTGGSPLEWIELRAPCLREAVRRRDCDPWTRMTGVEFDALTERRRRKLQYLSLEIDDEFGESVA